MSAGVNRYNLHLYEGQWVKAEEHDAEIERLQARVRALEAAAADGGPATVKDWEALRDNPNFDYDVWVAYAASRLSAVLPTSEPDDARPDFWDGADE